MSVRDQQVKHICRILQSSLSVFLSGKHFHYLSVSRRVDVSECQTVKRSKKLQENPRAPSQILQALVTVQFEKDLFTSVLLLVA